MSSLAVIYIFEMQSVLTRFLLQTSEFAQQQLKQFQSDRETGKERKLKEGKRCRYFLAIAICYRRNL